jgi:hypothetical protein
MTDNTAPSYIDSYVPPTAQAADPQSSDQTTTPQVQDNSQQAPMQDAYDEQPIMPPEFPQDDQDDDTNTQMSDDSAAPGNAQPSQSLEDQNIFFLLGITDGSEQEREEFLDELQQVIWEDFLGKDVELLVTSEELKAVEAIRAQEDLESVAKQEKIIEYLEKLIPDLEEIMLEKALELKADMMHERLAGMREFFADKPDTLIQIDAAEKMIAEEQWRSAAELLNGLQ